MLSDDTIIRLMCENLAPNTRKATLGYDIEALCRAIEAAVLAELAGQEPVAWRFVQHGFAHYTEDKRDWYDAVDVEEVTPLFAAPVVQKKQEPAYTFHLDSTGAAYLRGECVSKEGDPLYTAPIVQPDDLKDAERYRWIRKCAPFSTLKNISKSYAENVPDGEVDARLDAAIDAAMSAEKEQA